jgi:hypothetical protein
MTDTELLQERNRREIVHRQQELSHVWIESNRPEALRRPHALGDQAEGRRDARVGPPPGEPLVWTEVQE